jgi:hypothetical protein
VLPTPYRQLLTIGLLAGLLGGCDATGDIGGSRTISDAALPFTFALPSDFTKQPVDEANSRGDVVVAAGVSKVDVVAVRRVGGAVPTVPQRNRILGHAVTSELHAVEGAPGYAIECQYTSARADKVLAACRNAVRSVRRK